MALSAETREIIAAVEKLNESGKWITLQQCHSLLKHEMYRKETKKEEKALVNAWTGYYRGSKKKENVIYPEWG
jgi:hypothetical protein